ncbi:MAG TPA: redox-regulated ATPase YchF [Methylomirabilota bacterium]|jgi:GTP-binding protein YchF|nr:redox-regulated ATPase YchF [Methylomirabilota bacterium]
MSFSVGIVGLPNVGKSTLFNALTKQAVPASNFPFTTIDPNVGVIAVPDERLAKLAAQEKSEKIVPTSIEFVDIAGLVKGAAEGAGLGNKFLSHIREVDAIVQVVRFFENKDIIHVDGSVNPLRDIEVINLELMLADLNTVNKRLESLGKEIKAGKKESVVLKTALDKIKVSLDEGHLARTVSLNEEEAKLVKGLQLLTMKPTLYVANSSNPVASINNIEFLPIDIKIEAELSELTDEERVEYMKELNMTESGLDSLAKAAYKLLNLITFITAGPMESKAWTIVKGTKAPQAAGVIHTDFEKGFIKAEVIAWDKLLEAGGYGSARDKGWLRLEGKEYVVVDGDVVHFRFNN